MTTEQRNILGAVGWSLLAFVLGVVVWPVMVAREIWQYFRYLKPCGLGFEWLDVAVYSIFIGIFALFHWCLFDLMVDNLPWWAAI